MLSVGSGWARLCLLLLVVVGRAVVVGVSAVMLMYRFSLSCIFMLSKIAFVASVRAGLWVVVFSASPVSSVRVRFSGFIPGGQW